MINRLHKWLLTTKQQLQKIPHRSILFFVMSTIFFLNYSAMLSHTVIIRSPVVQFNSKSCRKNGTVIKFSNWIIDVIDINEENRRCARKDRQKTKKTKTTNKHEKQNEEKKNKEKRR